MPDPAPQVDLVKDGRRISVPLDQAASLLQSGYKQETPDEAAQAITSGVKSDIYGSAGAQVVSGLAGLARGASLGLSDVALKALGGGEALQNLREQNPYTSLATEIVGGLSPIGPAGQLAKVGAKVGAIGEGANIVGRTAAAAAGGAIEGAGQSAGSYLSQSALEDKPLSAEGFYAAIGSGALIGGGAAGGLSLGESALVKAKTLFPRSQVTREAAQEAERAVSSELSAAAADGASLLDTAKAELAKNRLIKSTNDLETQQQLNALKVQREQERLAREQFKTQQATQRAANGGKRTRKTFEEPVSEPAAGAPSGNVGEGGNATVTTPAAGDDLLAKLQGTKQGLDDGKTLDQIADEMVAAKDPAHAKLLDATRELDETKSRLDAWLAKYSKGGKFDSGEVAAFERNQATRDWASSVRPKESGYYTKVPEGEGTALLPRGRQSVFRGSDEERAILDAKTMSKLQPEERVAADLAADDLAKRWAKPKTIGDEIVAGAPDVAQQVAPVEHTIAKALRAHVGEHVDATEDIVEAAKVIGDYERASANVADILGPVAPPTSQARAAQLRMAESQHAEVGAQSIADMAKEMEKRLPADVAHPSPTLKPVEASNVGKAGDVAAEGGGMLKSAADIGTVLEVMSSLGLPGVPDLKNLPVVGPILSLYLKARAANAVFRRLGGKVPANAETVIAKHSAQTRDRVEKAVDKMLDAGARGARKARAASGPLAALGTKLFDADRPERGESKPGKKADPYREYEARMHEIATASQPGAVADAVRKRVPTGDPALQAELVGAAERKMAFLSEKAPKKMALPTLLKGDHDWKPSKLQLEQFSRYIEAANDPAGVLEKLGDTGQITYEAAETLRQVYPALYKSAQVRLVQKAGELTETLPYARRVALSILFQVPVDGTMDSDFVSFLRQGSAANSAAPAQGSPVQAQPPTPTAAGPVMLGDRSMTRLDRRAGA